MRTRTISNRFEVREESGLKPFSGYCETEEQALELINRNYEYAKKQGYDHKDAKYIIVCEQTMTERGDNNKYLGETIVRFVCESAEYSFYEGEFVFTY